MAQRDRPLGVILFGVGALGALVLKCLGTGYPLIRVVGAVDHAADKAGRPLADVCRDFAGGDVVVRPTLAQCLAECRPEAHVL